MRVAIRADASAAMGAGHVMRCLALAQALAEAGAQVTFLSRSLPGDLNGIASECGFAVTVLEGMPNWNDAVDARASAATLDEPVDWLIVDHYGLDAAWERVLRDRAKRILAIDDLADREHDCDVLVDQNLIADMEDRYTEKTPPACLRLLGPRYAMLREEFRLARAQTSTRRGSLRRVLVHFGGGDASAVTRSAVTALAKLDRADLHVDVVAPPAMAGADTIRSACAALPRGVLHGHVRDMAVLMSAADLALGASGTSTWERCCVALPALTVALVEHQAPVAAAVAKAGAAEFLGRAEDVDASRWAERIEAIADPDRLRALSGRAFALVDGEGVYRIAKTMGEM